MNPKERTIDEPSARIRFDDRTTTMLLAYDINTRDGTNHQTPLHVGKAGTMTIAAANAPNAASKINNQYNIVYCCVL